MTNVERAIREAYSAHFIFTNMGYTPDEVFIGVRQVLNADPPGVYSVSVLRRGDKEFTFHQVLFITAEEEDQFKTAYEEFVVTKSRLSRKELNELVHSSDTWKQKAALLFALEAKGFRLDPGKTYH